MKHVKRNLKGCLTLLCGLAVCSSSFAQVGKTISGVVVDESGLPIIGANVLEAGSQSNGTITDLDGRFQLVLSKENASLLFSYIGYTTIEKKVDGNTVFEIVLKEDKQTLDEVVVVGYGVQKKKLVTGATSQVSSDDIMGLSSNGILGAMQSKIPGANITASSGMPGSGQKVVLRGLGTVGNSEPLYVIDGIAGADMAMLNPSDIESIDILKDAASAAIYGSRAANGVILITTKRAKEGKMQISYDGYYAIQNVAKRVEMLGSKDYMMMQDERLSNATNGQQKGYDWQSMLPGYLYDAIMSGEWDGTNWMEEAENKNAPMQNHAISLMGGNDVSRFSAGYSYSSQDGIYGKPVTPNYTKHNARMTSENVLLKNDKYDIITFNTSMIYSYVESSGIKVGNIYNNDIKNLMTAPPIMPLYNKDGGYYNAEDKTEEGWNFDNFAANPIGLMVDRNQNLTKTHRLMANASVEIQPILDLRIKSAFGYKLNAQSSREFTPQYNYASNDANGNEKVTQSSHLYYAWTWENTLSYKFKIKNRHDFDVVLGQSVEKNGVGEQMSASNSNMTFPQEFDYAWLTNTKGVSSANTLISGSPNVRNMLASFFGRVNYNLNETYMASIMMRADGSSAFARGHRWGYFPSVSAGWVISNEPWMKVTSKWLDFLKLRASWGQNGNCNISLFQYLGTVVYPTNCVYFFSNDKITQTQGAYANILPNPDITWETSEQFDLGIDAYFLNSKLRLAIDWYNKITRDWLVQAPILGSYGTGAPYINGGEVSNKGVELGLSWNDHVADFNYSVNLNLAYNKNEVTKISNGEGIIYGPTDVLDQNTDYLFLAQEGYPIGYFYGYKTAGIFQNEEQVKNTKAKVEDAAPGDLIFVDVNNDGVITTDDRTMIGNPHPDVNLGFGFNMEYKGFDFSLTANGAFGHQIAQSYRPQTNKLYYNYTKQMMDERWHGEGTSNTFPRLGNASNFNKVSDIYIQDADYVRIQNITVGYDFKRLWKKSPLKQMRLYLSLQNWFTFTGYEGLDPAVGYGGGTDWASGVDLGYYPTAKSFIVGANLKF